MKIKTAFVVAFLFLFAVVQVKFISTLKLITSNMATDKRVKISLKPVVIPVDKRVSHFQNVNINKPNQKLLFNDQNPIIVTKIKPHIPLHYDVILDNLPDSYVEQHTFSYQPFSIPPPFNLPPYILHSNGYKANLDNKLDCDENICSNPHIYLTQYEISPCGSNKLNCSDLSYFQVYYENQYTTGKVDVIKNALLPPNFICKSNNNNNNNNPNDYLKEQRSSTKTKRFDGTVVYLLVENSNSLEGFVLNLLPKIVQAESYLSDKNVKFYLDVAPKNYIIKQLLRRMGITSRRIIRSLQNNENVRVTADTLILPCSSPIYNPLSLQRAQYMLNIPFTTNDNDIEGENQNVIMYLSRNRGSNNDDTSRKVNNEREVILSLRRIAKTNSLRLIIYDNLKYNNADRVISMWDKVLIMVGPSGEAHFNMLFARRNVAVIEFFPGSDDYSSREDHFKIFKTASLLGLSYYSLPCKTEGNNFDMDVNTQNMEKLISLLVRRN